MRGGVHGSMADAEHASKRAEDHAANQADIEKYLNANQVEAAVQDVIQCLLAAKPDNPREWLLSKIEDDLSNDCNDLSESDLHRLFATARKITSEVVPQDAIDCVIQETLSLLECDRVSLFVFDRKMNMLRLYASNLATPIMVSPGQGIVGAVFNRRETVNIPDCYKSTMFDQSFDQKTGYMTSSLIAVPILDFESQAVGVIQAINKLPVGGNTPEAMEQAKAANPEETPGRLVGRRAVPFGRTDEQILTHLTQHVGIAMRNAEVYREAISTSERATGLLNTIQSLSQDLGTQSMLLTITMHAVKIVSSERATVFLVDEANEQLWSVSTDTGQEIRIPKKAGIAGLCCTSAKVINIPDAYADSRFNQGVDKKTGFRTQSILAIPMLEDDAARAAMKTDSVNKRRSLLAALEAAEKETPAGPKVIGVIQMINKVSFDGQLEIFDDQDVEVMELFAKTVGPKLALSSMISKRQGSTPASADRKEADNALKGPTDMSQGNTQSGRATRASAHALLSLGETEEEADEAS